MVHDVLLTRILFCAVINEKKNLNVVSMGVNLVPLMKYNFMDITLPWMDKKRQVTCGSNQIYNLYS